ncbi:C25 family cysteine peptidase [Dokdonella immobilis]|uniref:C25 family cysteine peptidase n=1 Tax=Dokdonella immobilis TaxID=578942 RepID=UPI0015876BA4|nr:C25 family cysteine peptidase [Dokdonella immobilis]
MTPFRNSLLAILFAPALAGACEGNLNVEIEHTGVYALGHEDVVAIQPGLAGCASSDLRLTNLGVEVPIAVADGGDGRFDPGDRIEWIGQQLHGPQSWFDTYSINNSYMLSVAPGPHARIRDERPIPGSKPAALERTLHFEQENLMIRLDQNAQKPGEEPDLWQWAKLTQADPKPLPGRFDLPELQVSAGKVGVKINFRGISALFVPYDHESQRPHDHRVEFRINDRLVERFEWDGKDEVSRELELPAAWLKAEGNQFELSIPKRATPWNPDNSLVDVVMFNWIEFRYAVGSLSATSPPVQLDRASNGSFAVRWQGESPPLLYGDDGVRRYGELQGNGEATFAAAPAGTTLYAAVDPLARPKSVRAARPALWSMPTTGYDYLIVSHPSLMEAIEPLADFHRKRGLKVAVADINDIYDGFNFGIPHPRAISNFVRTAWKDWPAPKPRFLLLVGDASFDIRHETYNDLAYAKFANNSTELNFSGHFSGIPATPYKEGSAAFADRNLIPTWQYPSPEGQSASDNPFGVVDDGYYPSVAVGRFPVVEPAEVSAIVAKTITYLTRPDPGIWRRDVMFITDESDYFKKSSDQLANSVSSRGFSVDKIYASPDEADNLSHQSAIKDGLNAGQLLVHFIGHGGRFIWRTGPPDLRKNHDLFTLDDVSELQNGGRLPMVLSMTCYSAPFDNPTEDSIGERFLREADKGAVAVFAASWRNSPSTAFSKSLVDELLVPGATIGEAIVRSKKTLQDRTLVEMYNLLGDPAVVLERPRADARLALDADPWRPSVLVSLPGRTFGGLVAMDWLDEQDALLSTTVRRVDETVFSVDIPKFPDGKLAKFVRLYANDERSGQDMSAGLSLAGIGERRSNGWRWPDGLRPAPRAQAADTLKRDGFDRHAAASAGND